jgi:colanic acid biosynthesis glycosyl transferase WcaI
MEERIVKKGVAKEKVELLEPRMDDSLTDIPPEEGCAFRQRYALGEKFLVTYSGNMGVKQGLDVVVDAAALNRSDSSILFLLVGDGADCARIQRRAAEQDLHNLRFLPLLNGADFRGLLKASGICLVTQQHSVSDIAFPSKMVTYLSAGRPVIASVNSASEVARITQESRAGKVVEAEDPVALLTAIRELRHADLQELGRNALEYASLRWSSTRVLGNLERSLTATSASAMGPLTQEGTIR